MRENNTWIRDEDFELYFVDPRMLILLENKFYGLYRVIKRTLMFLGRVRWAFRKIIAKRRSPKDVFDAITYRLFPPEDMRVPKLKNKVYSLNIPLETDEQTGWRLHPIFRGRTKGIRKITCHASSLLSGHCPHPPQHHKQEELLLLLSGEIDIILPQGLSPDENQRRRLKQGEFVYYPSQFAHTLETMGKEPADYLMFKWYADSINDEAPIGFGHYSMFEPDIDSKPSKDFYPRTVFEGPTTYLKKLHCHTTTLEPGAGYDPHIDRYDVAIVMLEGEVITLHKRVKPHQVIFYPAGKPHGMHNPGNKPAKYIVFEFHGLRPVVVNSVVSRVSCKVAKLQMISVPN